jgi:lysophospholipase L1-like esterase
MRFSMAMVSLILIVAGLLLPRPAGADAAAPQPVIVFFGDSLTQGLHASRPELTYRGLLLERLAKTRDAGPATVVIQDPVGLLDDAQRRVPQVIAARPSLVFLELGHHELWSDEEQLSLFEARYANILDRLLATGADVIPSTVAWLGYTPGSFQYIAALRLNAIVRRLAADRDLVVADLWTPTDRRADLISTPDDTSFIDPYRGDDLHPNDAGHRALAQAFWKAYRALRKRPLPLRTAPV